MTDKKKLYIRVRNKKLTALKFDFKPISQNSSVTDFRSPKSVFTSPPTDPNYKHELGSDTLNYSWGDKANYGR